jgi:hypothetical protein
MSRDLKLVLLTVGAVMAIAIAFLTWQGLRPDTSGQTELDKATENLRRVQEQNKDQ